MLAGSDKTGYTDRRAVAAAILAAAFGGLAVGFASLAVAADTVGGEMFASYLSHPLILLLNLLPPLLFSLFFYFLFKRAWAAQLCTSLLVLLPTAICFFKFEFRGDALLAEDFTLAAESAKMLRTYRLFMTPPLAVALGMTVVLPVLFAIFFRGRTEKRLRPRLISLALLAALCALWPLYASGAVYDTYAVNNDGINPWSDTQFYISKGFVYPFLHTLRSAVHPAPDGYNAKAAKAALDAYTSEDIPKDKRVDLVCVMLEAFNDFSRFDNFTFTEDIYAKYHALERRGVSGPLLTDIFAGDTRVSEREFLTGLPYSCLDDFITPANSYVWYLKANGYTVTGAHPCYAWFYNRQNINKNLGFDSYLFSENYFAKETGADITYDAKFFPMLLDLYAKRDRSAPYFAFHISYQGHGPYSDCIKYYEPVVKNGGWSDTDDTILNNYLGCIRETVGIVCDFADRMLAQKEPLVLVFFGDHMPWLGNMEATYEAVGLNIDPSTPDGFANRYQTQYLILANDAAKKLLGNAFSGKGKTVTAGTLMNEVFSLCGYKGNAYMQYMSDAQARIGNIHRTDKLTTDAQKEYAAVAYYYRRNFIY